MADISWRVEWRAPSDGRWTTWTGPFDTDQRGFAALTVARLRSPDKEFRLVRDTTTRVVVDG